MRSINKNGRHVDEINKSVYESIRRRRDFHFMLAIDARTLSAELGTGRDGKRYAIYLCPVFSIQDCTRRLSLSLSLLRATQSLYTTHLSKYRPAFPFNSARLCLRGKNAFWIFPFFPSFHSFLGGGGSEYDDDDVFSSFPFFLFS